MTDLKQFTQDAIRTESKIEKVKVNPHFLAAAMAISIASGNMLDQIKKHVFYGKQYNNDLLITDFTHIVEALDLLKQSMGLLEEEEIEIDIDPRVFHSIIGIATESTELLEALDFSGEEMDSVNIGEEFGDLDWYKAIGCDALGLDWDQILVTIIAKLKKRYPDAFTSKDAIERDINAEREILDALDIQGDIKE